jgi:hypothetical protein
LAIIVLTFVVLAIMFLARLWLLNSVLIAAFEPEPNTWPAMASHVMARPIRTRMGKLRSLPQEAPQVAAYRDLAREALDSVAIYNARAQWFECSGNETLAVEYRQLAQDALTRAQRYKDLADLAEKRAA